MKPPTKDAIQRRQLLTTLAKTAVGVACLPIFGCKRVLAGRQPTTARAQKGACLITEDNIEGPFYCPQAPSRTTLVSPKEAGQRLQINGRILASDCQTPLAGAEIEIWQADAKGNYDNTCLETKGSHKYRLRGQMKADAKGSYLFHTIVPGRYLNGPTYRPAHIHYKVVAPGHESLTTQLYFAGDPYIQGDPFVKSSLIIKLNKAAKVWTGTFDIVLQKKPGKPTPG